MLRWGLYQDEDEAEKEEKARWGQVGFDLGRLAARLRRAGKYGEPVDPVAASWAAAFGGGRRGSAGKAAGAAGAGDSDDDDNDDDDGDDDVVAVAADPEASEDVQKLAERAQPWDLAVPPSALPDTCPESECQRKARHGCTAQLPCGHRCFGVFGCHSTGGCPPCLKDDCAAKRKKEEEEEAAEEDEHVEGKKKKDGLGRHDIQLARPASASAAGGALHGGNKRIPPHQVPWGEPLVILAPDRFEEGTEYCKLCYTEALENAPCLTLDCGHVVHARCSLKRLLVGQAGHRLTFRYLQCHEPGCQGTFASLASTARNSPIGIIADAAKKRWAMYCSVRSSGEQRWAKHLKYAPEALAGGRFHGQPAEHALARLAFYACSECDRPFFGGAAQCGNGMDDAEDQNAGEGGGEDGKAGGRVDADNKLLCPTCMGPSVGVRSCPKHGADDMQMKCRYCCSVAVWRCWGSTSFCDSCHTKHARGEYLTHKQVSHFKQCKGASTCPLRV